MKIKVLIAVLFFFSICSGANAAFGVSPPYIKSDKVRPGTSYEQTISLLRASADKDQPIKVVLSAPEIASWISFSDGEDFVWPAGSLNRSFTVKVDVPEKAAIGNYKGKVSLVTAGASGQAGVISAHTGAEINIDLDLTRDIISDFEVRNAVLADWPRRWGFMARWPLASRFFGVRAVLKLANTGNIGVAPSRVTLEVLDIADFTLLAASADTTLKNVAPYKIEEIPVFFPLDLPVGQYWGNIKVYDGDLAVYVNNLAFSVYEEPVDKRVFMIFSGALIVILSGVSFIFYRWRKRYRPKA